MANTCCPQYTIRLDALQFDPGKDKKMRYLINRWKRYIVEGVKPGETIATEEKIEGKEKGGKKNRYDATNAGQNFTNLITSICHAETNSRKPRDTIISKSFDLRSTIKQLPPECSLL